MKQSPQLAKLEQLLRSSTIVAGGFMGSDPRSLMEIIEADATELRRLGRTNEELGARMQKITETARVGLGTRVRLDDHTDAAVEENRGMLICPWPEMGRHAKTITTVTRRDTGVNVHWSDLSAHLIRAHGFFQGRGSPYRIEPQDLVAALFTHQEHPAMAVYVCLVCGYEYDPSVGEPRTNTPANTPFEALPDAWRCPMCGAPKRMFKKKS
jgi:rubredoxin